ncbi:pantoate--beta-alanine ligase [Ginsengibacter hankyongi]|uniref:Pantothenate synthetase n=1 Tax=Ginsengibacter hankyongi TaxID=2607284 RepID=A0A5J5ICJ3_9BACT|nr:pantoate--beta-alanine ligase [Ginsengibacter hankyongi]KAA9034666.1 pantoate--beta-alanine ligase [Ginsengibacter hankyongi]
MILFKHSEDLRAHLTRAKQQNFSIGYVPTMGALHNGHLSLISQSKKKTDITVCSIFVNRVQFNNLEDFKKYPLSIENDILLLEGSGCDILFIPSEREIYPDAASKNKRYELGYLEDILEGKFRPGHFQGVCLVVEKFLNLIEPGYLFLGQKDYQQCLVIKKLVKLMGKKIKVFICPILREKNGLAMSSRNLRLNEEEKKLAAQLYKSLTYIKNNLQHENFPQLRNKVIKSLEKNGFKVDYLELAKSKNLKIVEKYNKADDLIILIAAFLNDVRLIDNILVKDVC